MRNIYFITSSFPFYPGEQFIEEEIVHLAGCDDFNVTIMPLTSNGNPRAVPQGVEVDLCLANNRGILARVLALRKLVFQRVFWREVAFVAHSGNARIKKMAELVKLGTSLVCVSDALGTKLSDALETPVIYCYWNGAGAYSSVLYKTGHGSFYPVVSRAHGGDLYEERSKLNYLPFKRQFVNSMDVILSISLDGKKYLEERFGVHPDRCVHLPLGVEVPAVMAAISSEHYISVLSVSFLIPVKRIDRIIDALELYAKENPNLNIKWRHIGGGPLDRRMKQYAEERLSGLDVDWRFLGEKTNEEVKRYYREFPVDVFINASESEGVPVSIMEAMSFGVPVIAPDVGGVREIVSPEVGELLSSNPGAYAISVGMTNISAVCKDWDFRKKSRERIVKSYNAAVNYKRLIEVLEQVELPK